MIRFVVTLALVVLTGLGLAGTATADTPSPVVGSEIQSIPAPNTVTIGAQAYNSGVWSLQMQDRVLRGFRVIPKGQTSLQNGIADVSWVRTVAGLCMRRQIKDPRTGFFGGWSGWMHGPVTSFVGYRSVTTWAVVSC